MRLQFSILAFFFLMVSSVAQAGIYRWVDDNGRAHFSDEPPSEAEAEDIEQNLRINTVPANLFFSGLDPYGLSPDVEITLKALDFELSAAQQAEAESAIRVLYTIYAQFFEWPKGRRLPIIVTFVRSPELFMKARKALTGRTSPAVGFYVLKEKESYVLAHPRWKVSLQVALHEVSHAVLQARVDDIPLWINEGLASNFEYLEVHSDGVYLGVPDEYMRRISGLQDDGVVAGFRQFLGMSYQQWHAVGEDRKSDMYALSWGVVHYFLTDPARRRVLRDMIHAAGRHPEKFDVQALINLKYPGGVARFTREWHDWYKGEYGRLLGSS